MKNHYFFITLIISLFISAISTAQDVTPVLSNGNYSFTLGDVAFEVSPSTGGRISSLKYKNQQMMWVDKYTVANMWGSTFWASPQARWNWPPSPTLDQNAYSGGIVGNKVVLSSQQDYSTGTTGLQFKKIFYMNAIDTSISIIYTIKNINAATNSWSAWEITRVPTGGLTLYPTGTTAISGTLSGKVQKQINVSWYDNNASDAAGSKFIQDGSDGWLAHVNENNVLFVKKFDDVLASQQAPGEGEIEVYLNSATTYIELENQGKYTSLVKGDSIQYEVKWFLKALPTGVTATVGNQTLVDFVKEVINPSTQNISTSVKSKELIIYPNPVSDYLIISNNSSFNSLNIYQIDGALVSSKKLVGLSDTISLSELANGIYFFEFKGNQATLTKKIIVKH